MSSIFLTKKLHFLNGENIQNKNGIDNKNVKEFLAEYKASKAEYTDYQSAVAKWEQQTGNKAESDSMKARLQRKQQEVKELNRHNMPQKKYSRDAR